MVWGNFRCGTSPQIIHIRRYYCSCTRIVGLCRVSRRAPLLIRPSTPPVEPSRRQTTKHLIKKKRRLSGTETPACSCVSHTTPYHTWRRRQRKKSNKRNNTNSSTTTATGKYNDNNDERERLVYRTAVGRGTREHTGIVVRTYRESRSISEREGESSVLACERRGLTLGDAYRPTHEPRLVVVVVVVVVFSH